MAAVYQPQVRLPSWLVREVATVVELPVYVDAVLTAPTSGTYTLVRPDGTEAVSAAATTTTASVSTRSVTLASTEALGEGWQERWDLTYSGVVRTFYRDAACVLRAYRCVVSSADIEARHPELTGQYPGTATSWAGIVAEADVTVQDWLIQQGRRPYLVLNPWATRAPTLLWALCYAFRACSTHTGEGSRFAFFAEKYEAEAKSALSALVLTYDENADNHPDASEQGNKAGAVVWLSAPPLVGQARHHYPWGSR